MTKKYCKICKAWNGENDFSSCTLKCRQAFLTTNNDELIPFDDDKCFFPQTEKDLNSFKHFTFGKFSCPYCSGRGCGECDNKGDILSFRKSSTKCYKMYCLFKQLEKVQNIFNVIYEYRDAEIEEIENLFIELIEKIISKGNKIENEIKDGE